ncbi:MAG: DUF885 family protein [Armatimonadetes bacterium]|nr:DUF885 family protein [Armatimonadota bacterium]
MAYTLTWEDFPANTDRVCHLIRRFQADREALNHLLTTPWSPIHREKFREFYQSWQTTIDRIPFDCLSPMDRADWVLLNNLLVTELRNIGKEEARWAEMEPLLPALLDLIALEDERRQLVDIDPVQIAERLDSALTAIRYRRRESETDLEAGREVARTTVANRAAQALASVLLQLEEWYGFYAGYDPLFTWWVECPYQAWREEAVGYVDFLRKRLANAKNGETIIGDPVGREGILDELRQNLIPYSPEELIAIARREAGWCQAELIRAAQDMGLGDDWRQALESVKSRHVAPGEQPRLIRDLANEAVEFLERHDLLTINNIARETWCMQMMSPEMQKVNPFFLGGEDIIVSFPTNAMEHAQKQMSLRGNNRHFARATVQHELIPGHRMQMLAMVRYHDYRTIFYTPFWMEGWTLHWEMLLWDLGFAQSPEDRIGMLFWRLHRCARVEFSLGFHLGKMTPQECVEMLVNEVGHERANAEAEVRRSFGGDYDPLYQLAYLIGGLQVRALHREVVEGGKMSHRQFHDAFLGENCVPISLLRALFLGEPIEREFDWRWRFCG